MAVAHNKIITCGVKCKNTLVAFALDLNENSEMYQRREALQLKKAHIDKPTRQVNFLKKKINLNK